MAIPSKSSSSSLIPEFLSLIVCPQCQGELVRDGAHQAMMCHSCQMAFKLIPEGIDLRPEAALILTEQGKLVPLAQQHITLTPLQGPVQKLVTGSGKRAAIRLTKGTCVVVARATETLAASDDDLPINLTSHLSENAKKMLSSFMMSRKRNAGAALLNDARFFYGFRRLPDIIVLDTSISKAHCLFFYDDTGPGLLDLFSLNGTFINGKEVESCALTKGDIVQFGQSALQISAQ